MQVVLSMFRSDGDRRSFSLHKDTTVVGRREDCDLRIPLGEISRKHCKIMKNGQNLKIEDLGSSNGTYRNGQRVQEATVEAGDTIQIGSIAFVVQIDGTPADDDMQPVLAQKAAVQASGAPVSDSADSDVNLETAEESAAGVEAESESESEPVASDDSAAAQKIDENADGGAEGEFDPMAFLEGGDSQASGGAIAMDLDQSNAGESAD